MKEFQSRMVRIEDGLRKTAEKGLFLGKVIVYPGEIKRLEKKGFIPIEKSVYSEAKSLFSVTVKWSEDSKEGSLAKELYFIAKRANKSYKYF